MGSHTKSRFWRVCRVYFRRFRISVWMLLLTVLAAVVYLNQVGLPDLVKRPLLQKLRDRGLDLQFSRLRLSWTEGIVAENVHFGSADKEFSPHLNVEEVRVLLNWERLAHLQFQVDSLMLRHGRVSWAFADTNQARRELSITNIQTDLRFLPEDKWSLDNFRAQLAGARLQLSGVVTNASTIRDWKIFQGQQPASRSAELWETRLRTIADTLNQIHFSAAPELRVMVRGDALDLHTFNVLLSLSAPGAQTPWGTAKDGRFAARLLSVDSNGVSRAEVDLHASAAQTPWGAITNCSLNLYLSSAEGETNLVKGNLKLTAGQVLTQWARGSNAVFTAAWTHAITNPIPIFGDGQFACDFAQTPWASAANIQLRASLTQSQTVETPIDPGLAWWTNLWPYRLSWECRLVDLIAAPLKAERIACAGDWVTPQLTVTNLEATVSGGRISAKADLDTMTRAAHASLSSDCDAHVLASYLSENVRNWMSQFYWPESPRLNAELSVKLPSWTNWEPDWRGEILPGALLTGQLVLPQGGGFRQLQISSAQTHFIYSNQCWYLPDFLLNRPEGQLALDQKFDELTGQFYARMTSTIDPMIARPFLDEPAQRAFDLINFSNPPAISMQVWGHVKEPEQLLARGSVSVSNFTFRGEQFSKVTTQVEYTNQQLRFFAPRVDIGKSHLEADGLLVDLNAQFVYVTNGFSTADPMVVARAIGPNVARDIVDYEFREPPTAHVYGAIPLHGEAGADLHFDLTGGPFHWWKFHVPHITGQVHWAGLHLDLTNLQAEFYHGVATGAASFDFPENQPTQFQFNLNATNVLFQSLMSDLSPGTNQPEGRLAASLAVTKATTENLQTVFGFGEAHLHDGLLWDIPLFGVFSPILNGIAPGLGNNRASAAEASFIITNGVVRTDDLVIRSTGTRLQYRGTVNLEGQLNARVDAELLRDMWLVGPLVSTVFWPVTKLFEYRVTGTLADPRTQPVFVLPKLMLLPFHPLRTLKGLRPEDPNSNPNFSPLPP
jgi:hypothetical protein